MFEVGSIYTHRYMIDSAVYVSQLHSLVDGQYCITIQWRTRRGLNLGIVEKIVIKNEEVKNWYLI
jgi:hypothetical protein